MTGYILHVTRSHKRTKGVVTRRVFESPNAFGGRAPPGPAGGASALPQTHELKSGDKEAYSPTSKGKGENGRERKGEKTEGRGGEGIASSLCHFWLHTWQLV